RIISASPKRTEPLRLPMMPMIDFKVVVLPAPLRPSRVTTSPEWTLKSMPCRIWDSPYQASRFWTFSTWRVNAAVDLAGASVTLTSGMTGSQIGFLDALVPGELGIIALRKHLSAGQHGNDVGRLATTLRLCSTIRMVYLAEMRLISAAIL